MGKKIIAGLLIVITFLKVSLAIYSFGSFLVSWFRVSGEVWGRRLGRVLVSFVAFWGVIFGCRILQQAIINSPHYSLTIVLLGLAIIFIVGSIVYAINKMPKTPQKYRFSIFQ